MRLGHPNGVNDSSFSYAHAVAQAYRPGRNALRATMSLFGAAAIRSAAFKECCNLRHTAPRVDVDCGIL